MTTCKAPEREPIRYNGEFCEEFCHGLGFQNTSISVYVCRFFDNYLYSESFRFTVGIKRCPECVAWTEKQEASDGAKVQKTQEVTS
jgi:hypothetical protein